MGGQKQETPLSQAVSRVTALFRRWLYLLRISGAQVIARRYFVTNGFDGALTMLGLAMGFYVSEGVPVTTAIGACLGAAIALAASGVTSAYMSESAERRKELNDLEQALVSDLSDTHHEAAARLVPVFIALVNGAAPFLIAIVIIAPLWLAQYNLPLPLAPLETAIGVALAIIFLLGVFLGRISGAFWLWAGLRTLAIALATGILVLLTVG